MAKDERGVPRLIRSIVPRAGLAGAAPEAIARDHVAALSRLWVQRATPMALVEKGSQLLRNGARVVSLAQEVDGVVVDQGEVRVLMHVDGSLAAVSGTLLPAVTAPTFVSSPRQALERALDQQFGAARPALTVSEGASVSGWQTLEVSTTPELQVSDARARRVVTMIDNKPTPTWEVEVLGQAAPDPLSEVTAPIFSAHSYLIEDGGGTILRDDNLEAHDAYVYRVYAETTGNRRPLDGPLQSFSPHPTGQPDGSAPAGFVPSNLVVMDSFNGPGDPWLPNNATTAAGNNAESFADLDGNNVFSTGDIRPEVRAGRVLNYTYNHELEPLATPDQSKASAVNAFFVVNWFHDWFYDSGFTEATRNAQLDNFGRGGIANDRLLILAQAGANANLRNNATMATPADGARPRMRMFLWTAGADGVVTGPAGALPTDTFSAGPRTFNLTGELAIGVDTTAPTDDGCGVMTGVTGKIALVTYVALCNSQTVVNNARASGAAGVLLIDGLLDQPRAFGGSATANLPGLVVGRADGQSLKDAMTNGPVTVNLDSLARGAERDGDFDNGVVAHEWGHYMHRRLAPGQCGPQCGGMSEGWGDFMSVLMMLREGDNRDGVYAVAPYALNDGDPDTAYFGIRRFPYSTDRTKNDLSFRHIDDRNELPTTTPGLPGGVNSEVHNTGEIWTTMMWDVLNVLADQHGVTVARRRVTDYIVAGLLLHPTNATFTEARDAILIAVSALDTDDMLLLAGAFAGRGIGSCAVSPPRNSQTNLGVVESGTIAARLTAGTPQVTDDGPRGDRDGSLEPGEAGQIRLTVANGGVLAAEQVTLTATSSVAGVQIGAPRPLALLPEFSTTELTIPVTVQASVPRGTSVTFTLRVTGEHTCDRTGLTIPLTIQIGGAGATEPARVAATADGSLAIHRAPATSLRAHDAAVCIAQDTP